MGRGRNWGRRAGPSVRAFALLFVASLFAACGGGSSASTKPSVAGATGAPDAAGIVWLCRPGMAGNPCEMDLSAAAVNPDGSTTPLTATAAAEPSVDCFYVYPQVSAQTKSLNAELVLEPTVVQAARSQAAPFSTACRVYAPLYPQLTTSALAQLSLVTPAQTAKAYDGVANAFRDYLDNYSQGRGFILIGHSEGAFILEALLAKVIDADASLRARLVSAYLMGANVGVPAGKAVGGDFASIPLCTAKAQTGCIVAFEAYGRQPSAASIFGRMSTRFNPFVERANTPDLRIACVNPAGLDGGTANLEPMFLTDVLSYVGLPKPSGKLPAWLTYPGQYTAHCETASDEAGDVSWLQVDPASAGGDQRPAVVQLANASLGLHDVEFNLTLGNLVTLANAQAAAYGR